MEKSVSGQTLVWMYADRDATVPYHTNILHNLWSSDRWTVLNQGMIACAGVEKALSLPLESTAVAT